MNEQNVVLKIRDVHKSFGATHALQGVNMDICQGEVHAIVGSNGAGKSTLMKVLAGIYVPDKGTIQFEGKDIIGLSPLELQKLGIQVVHQVLHIVGSMTVLENILLSKPSVHSGILRWKDGLQEVQETLKLIDFPLDLKATAGSLSVSEQQFVILARALVRKTKVLVLDEPTARLGMDETNKLFNLIRKLKEQGITIIYISHRMEEIYTISDRISVFRNGLMVDQRPTREFPKEALVSAMLGKKMDSFYPKISVDIGENVLNVEHLQWQDRLNDVSFKVNRGEIVSLVGPVGAGKTEICEILFGILKKDGGKLTVLGNEITARHTPSRAIEMGIALIPEDRSLQGMWGTYAVRENITSVDLRQIASHQIMSRKKESRMAQDLCNKLDVRPNDINYVMDSLSGGNQQKVCIGKWLTNEYGLYLMDEVTAGVDIEAKAAIYEIMGSIVKNGGSILLATGDVDEALGISDRIIVLYKGKIALETKLQDTSKDQLLTAIMGGTVHES